MTSKRLRAAFAVALLIICSVQAGKSDDRTPIPALNLIRRILRSGYLSGSLAYSGCGFDKRVPPDLPPFGVLDESGPPEEILRKLFSADPLMKVTREGSMIRMMETRVATDLLNVKIHHVSFFPSDASDSDAVHGPRMALLAILEAPEVVAFGKAHAIRSLPSPDKFMSMPGDCCGGGRIVHGELNDVTVSEALDYVLQTFPGYWIYENCGDKEGERSGLLQLRMTLTSHARC
jgi:hypothetical protein